MIYFSVSVVPRGSMDHQGSTEGSLGVHNLYLYIDESKIVKYSTKLRAVVF